MAALELPTTSEKCMTIENSQTDTDWTACDCLKCLSKYCMSLLHSTCNNINKMVQHNYLWADSKFRVNLLTLQYRHLSV